MPRVVFHESENSQKPDHQSESEVQNADRQKKKRPKVGIYDYMHGVVVLAAI